MVEYFRGSARRSAVVYRLLQIAAALAFFFVVTSQFSFAQNGTFKNDGSTVVLQIRVNIVPAVMSVPPSPEPRRPPLPGVTYNVSTTQPNVEVTEETRPFLVPGDNGAGIQDAVLRTQTIVIR